jgi:hypothetical protein
MRELPVVVGGTRLTDAQASALRVAVAMFLSELADPKFRAELGDIADGYRARLAEVQGLMLDLPSSPRSPAWWAGGGGE